MTGADNMTRARVTGYTLALNYMPLTQILVGVVFVCWQATSTLGAVLWALSWLYLLPPLVSPLSFVIVGRPHGRALSQDARAYKVWWFTHQWQIVFNRIPWL